MEPIADQISPKAVKFFTKPLITILVTGTVGLVVIGPIGTVISNLIGSAVNGLNNYVSWLVPALVGALTPLLVMTGTHYGLIPIGINNRMTIGYDTLIYPGMLGSNVAQGGAALAVASPTSCSEILPTTQMRTARRFPARMAQKQQGSVRKMQTLLWVRKTTQSGRQRSFYPLWRGRSCR